MKQPVLDVLIGMHLLEAFFRPCGVALAVFSIVPISLEANDRLERKLISRYVDISGSVARGEVDFDGQVKPGVNETVSISDGGFFGGGTGLAYLKSRVNANKPCRLILDTGSQVTVLEAKVAEDAKVPVGANAIGEPYSFQAIGPHGSEEFLYGNVGRLNISNFVVSDFLCGIRRPQQGGGSFNILGLDILKECNFVVLDWRNEKVTLNTASRFRGGQHRPIRMIRSGNWKSHPAIYVPLLLPGGVTVNALLDTGTSNALQLPRSVLEKIPTANTRLVEGNFANRGIGGTTSFSAVMLDEVGLGALRANNVKAFISDGGQAVVGTGLLRKSLVVLDFDRGLVWVE